MPKVCVCDSHRRHGSCHLSEVVNPLELHLTTSELWFGEEQEGILP